MKTHHSFDSDKAKAYGVDEAIVINSFEFWLLLNATNRTNFYDGRVWTYNTTKGLAEFFSYWDEKKMWRIIKSLQKQGVLVCGNYNNTQFDRTQWYSFTDEFIDKWRGGLIAISETYRNKREEEAPFDNNGKSISQKEEIHFSKMENGFDNNGKSISQKEEIHLTEKENHYKETVYNTVDNTVYNNNNIIGQNFEKIEPVIEIPENTPPVAAAPPKPKKLAVDVKRVEGSKFGDGELHAMCLEYEAKYGVAMIEKFLYYWTAPMQSGPKKGQELWRTKPTFLVSGRLATWNGNNFDNQTKQNNGPLKSTTIISGNDAPNPLERRKNIIEIADLNGGGVKRRPFNKTPATVG